MKRETLRALIDSFGQKYSDFLDIKLEGGDPQELFKWFLAAVLFGAPITEKAVVKTYRCFERHRVTTPKKILETGWQGLVDILDEGSYTRYDFKTADKLLEVMNNLIEKYDGDLNRLHEVASGPADLERRLKELGKGMGPVTVSIFLRDLRGIWEKAAPKPTPLVVLAAKNLGIIKREHPEEALKELKDFWEKNKVPGKTFVNFETALLRIGKDFCRKGKCDRCLVKQACLAIASA